MKKQEPKHSKKNKKRKEGIKMNKNKMKLIIAGMTIGGGLLAVAGGVVIFTETIEGQSVGVVYDRFDGGIQDEVLMPGMKVVGIGETITQFPTSTASADALDLVVNSIDGKSTKANFQYSYHVSAEKAPGIVKKFGRKADMSFIETGFMRTILQSSAKNVTEKYSIFDLVGGKSSEITTQIQEKFADELKEFGIIIENLAISSVEMDAGTQASMDELNIAHQKAEKEKVDKLAAETRAEANANVKRLESDAFAYEITAKAKAQAEANELVSKSLTDELIQMKEADARLVHGWVTITGSDKVIVQESQPEGNK